MKRRCKSILYLPMAIILCFCAVQARPQTSPVDMKEAIAVALSTNEGLRADSLNIAVAAYRNKELAGYYLPQVSFSSRFNYNIAVPSQMLPGSVLGQPDKDLIPVQFGTKFDAVQGLEVNQVLYRKDLSIRMKAAPLQKAIAETRHRLTREDLVYQVAANFYSLQSNAEKIRSTTTDYLNMKDMERIAKAQLEEGILKKIDYESLQINVANKQSELSQLQTGYKEQLDYFKWLIGLPAATPLVIKDSIISLPAPAIDQDTHLAKREDLLLYRQLADAKEVELKSIRAESKPVVSSFFRYNYQSMFNSMGKAFNSDYGFKNSTVGLSTSISLFDGNRRKNRIKTAQTELLQLKLQTSQQQQKAVTELSTARQTLAYNQEQHQVNNRNLVLAEKVFLSRKALYTEGVTTLVELLDAERELTQARNLYTQSLINVQTGLLNVHQANGTLLTEFLNAL